MKSFQATLPGWIHLFIDVFIVVSDGCFFFCWLSKDTWVSDIPGFAGAYTWIDSQKGIGNR